MNPDCPARQASGMCGRGCTFVDVSARQLRIAGFNVENLFNRARALDQRTWSAGRPVLEAYQRVCTLLEETVYTAEVRHDILRELNRLGLRNGDTAKFARLRQNRGRLVRRSRDGRVEVVADGRADWIGWVELTTDRVDELALFNTARVLLDVRADIVGVVEAESRLALKRFADAGVVESGRPRYPHVMVVDGNDERGIDVGVMSTHDYQLIGQRTHVDDADTLGRIFSRDCAEYHFRSPGGQRIAVLVNHFKSKGYGGKVRSDEIRRRQAHEENAAEIGHAAGQHALAGHRASRAVLLMHHAVHGGTAHVGISRISRRDLKGRGADIGSHDQQGQNPTERFHKHPL